MPRWLRRLVDAGQRVTLDGVDFAVNPTGCLSSRMRLSSPKSLLPVAAGFGLLLCAPLSAQVAASPAPAQPAIGLPLRFVTNAGQWNAAVRLVPLFCSHHRVENTPIRRLWSWHGCRT